MSVFIFLLVFVCFLLLTVILLCLTTWFGVLFSSKKFLYILASPLPLGSSLLKLKFQYFGHLMRRIDSLEKTLMLGKIEGRRRRDDRGWDGWMVSPNQWTWVWMDSRSWWWTGRPGVLPSMGSKRVGHQWATEQLNWTELSSLLELSKRLSPRLKSSLSKSSLNKTKPTTFRLCIFLQLTRGKFCIRTKITAL